MEHSMDRTYTRMLHKALNIHWSSYNLNKVLYGDIPHISNTVVSRRLQLVGPCFCHPELSVQPPLVLWKPSYHTRRREIPKAIFLDTLKRDTCAEDTWELSTLMRDKSI
jgi:hypothetical protein